MWHVGMPCLHAGHAGMLDTKVRSRLLAVGGYGRKKKKIFV
jgi:hypothetical protein